MSTAEQLAFSIRTEGRGIHVLLWDDQADLVRALVSLRAAWWDLQAHTLLISDDHEDLLALKKLIETRVPILEHDPTSNQDFESSGRQFWILFLQQASSSFVGPWLNGWRRPISEPPGALLVIRHADFASFQRSAPDIASFIGARIYDASTMLSVFSKTTFQHLESRLPVGIEQILSRLPGTAPLEPDIANWIEANAPDEA